MIYTIGNQKLDVPETRDRKARTPRQVVPWRDVAETCRTLDAICGEIQTKPKPFKIVDGIARGGFWGKVFRNRWPKCKIHLNEEDAVCLPVLKKNFPNDKITSNDIHEWTPNKSDIVLLDFDHFTLNILDQWKDVLERYSPTCKYFIIADGACFGFKFGNLKHYGVSEEEDYFGLLGDALSKFLDKRITVVSKFSNASTILLENKRPNKIKFLPPTYLFLSRGGKLYKPKLPKPSVGFNLI